MKNIWSSNWNLDRTMVNTSMMKRIQKIIKMNSVSRKTWLASKTLGTAKLCYLSATLIDVQFKSLNPTWVEISKFCSLLRKSILTSAHLFPFCDLLLENEALFLLLRFNFFLVFLPNLKDKILQSLYKNEQK